MAYRPTYLVDVFEHLDGRLQRVLREEAETSREAIATARIFVAASAGSIAYLAARDETGRDLMIISSLEVHGEVPADYASAFMEPWTGVR